MVSAAAADGSGPPAGTRVVAYPEVLDTVGGDVLRQASRLAASGHEWIDTFDINPLVFDGERFVAVDGLCLLRAA